MRLTDFCSGCLERCSSLRILGLALKTGACLAAITPMAEPSLSPDRKDVAFVSGGDIWTVPTANAWHSYLIAMARRTSTF